MRPNLILSIFTPLLIAGGAACAVMGSWQVAGDWRRTSPIDVQILASVLLLLGAGCAVLRIAGARRQCRQFTKAIGQMKQTHKLRGIDCDNAVLRPLAQSLNELVEMAEHSITDAARRIKEMEIQLKVVAGERQDAQAILHSISDAVLVTDSFDELVLANESAAKAFGFDPEKACGAPVQSIVKDPKVVELIREMRQSRTISGRRIIEHTLKSGEGNQGLDRVYKITLSCVADQPDGQAGVVSVLHDMTREREVAQMKSDFVSNVSHELRTPLASIKAYVEMLIDGEAEDKKTEREFHEVIQSEANRLSRLIDNILSISRIESGLVQVNKQPQSLTVILKEAIEVITPQARNKQIAVVEKLTPVFYQTLADKDMLYQAVLNLLSNAVKYTPVGGSVTIETLVDEAGRKVVTRISDTGVGIVPKDLPHVFDKFFRSESNKHMAKGTGLGLSLVKHIIESAHKGRLFAESQVGKGSCFGFELELTK